MEIGPRPSLLNMQFSKKSNSTRKGKHNHSRRVKKWNSSRLIFLLTKKIKTMSEMLYKRYRNYTNSRITSGGRRLLLPVINPEEFLKPKKQRDKLNQNNSLDIKVLH